MDEGYLKLYRSELDVNQRRQIADLISQFFPSQGFPGHKRMDLDLANHLAGELPGLICEDVEGETTGLEK